MKDHQEKPGWGSVWKVHQNHNSAAKETGQMSILCRAGEVQDQTCWMALDWLLLSGSIWPSFCGLTQRWMCRTQRGAAENFCLKWRWRLNAQTLCLGIWPITNHHTLPGLHNCPSLPRDEQPGKSPSWCQEATI